MSFFFVFFGHVHEGLRVVSEELVVQSVLVVQAEDGGLAQLGKVPGEEKKKYFEKNKKMSKDF